MAIVTSMQKTKKVCQSNTYYKCTMSPNTILVPFTIFLIEYNMKLIFCFYENKIKRFMKSNRTRSKFTKLVGTTMELKGNTTKLDEGSLAIHQLLKRIAQTPHTSQGSEMCPWQFTTCSFRLISTRYSGDVILIPVWHPLDTQAPILCKGHYVANLPARAFHHPALDDFAKERSYCCEPLLRIGECDELIVSNFSSEGFCYSIHCRLQNLLRQLLINSFGIIVKINFWRLCQGSKNLMLFQSDHQFLRQTTNYLTTYDSRVPRWIFKSRVPRHKIDVPQSRHGGSSFLVRIIDYSLVPLPN